MEQDRIVEILRHMKCVAVLGAHREQERAAFYVPEYLHQAGYRVIGVNPRFAGEVLWGERVRTTLAELDEEADLVDVFRPAASLPGHLDDLLAMRPLPQVVWFQLGIRHDEVAAALEERGIEVVQDRCTLADHRALLARR